jgi:hypothetical protein
MYRKKSRQQYRTGIKYEGVRQVPTPCATQTINYPANLRRVKLNLHLTLDDIPVEEGQLIESEAVIRGYGRRALRVRHAKPIWIMLFVFANPLSSKISEDLRSFRRKRRALTSGSS